MNLHSITRLMVPGLVFQSAMIGGGYATGRELVTFFLALGPLPGLLAMMASTAIISLFSSAAFEFARRFQLYDYRAFFGKLLGPGWLLFELAYLALILLILSVLGAASNELLRTYFGLPGALGSVLLMAAVGGLVFWGPRAIRNVLASWSVLLYLTYGVLIAWTLRSSGDSIAVNLSEVDNSVGSLQTLQSGMTYAGYNLVVFISVLFLVRGFRSRREAILAGTLCGPLCMIPGFMLLLAMMAHYPAIVEEPLPINFILDQIQFPGLLLIVQVVIFGTFIETGTALLHSVNERIARVYDEKALSMPRLLRPAVSVLFLMLAIYVAEAVGILNLVANGYGYATYLFWLIMVIPVLTRGVWMLYQGNSK